MIYITGVGDRIGRMQSSRARDLQICVKHLGNECAGLMIYCHPDCCHLKVAEWTKEVSAKWRALSDDEKVPFDKLAKKDKERYFSAMALYKGKDANKPKRPMSSYFLWLGDFRAQNKDKYAENKDLLRGGMFPWVVITFLFVSVCILQRFLSPSSSPK